MPEAFPSERFWLSILTLAATHPVVIDRPKGTAHPRYPDFLYPVDYGYLEGTTSIDQGGIDIWRGSLTGSIINGIICTVDLNKSDSEIKILMNCSEREITEIFNKHNEYTQAGIWIPNPILPNE